MKIYCANCGLSLKLIRKALPKYATIVDLVAYHECLEEPVEIDLKAVHNEPLSVPGKDKFVKKLSDLGSTVTAIPGGISTEDLRDRRFERGSDEQAKSTAPLAVLDHVKTAVNSAPVHELVENPESED
jgi:hypothetical protein